MAADSDYGNFRATSYPLRLYSGVDALSNLPAEVERAGARRAFVICGRSVGRRTDLVHRIASAIGERFAGCFDEMDKDSSFPAVMAATAAAREAGADLLIALGGGSVIVGTRAVAIFLGERGDPFELMTQYPPGKPAYSPRLNAPKPPIINVPTTPTTAMNRAGTGLKNDDLDHRMEYYDPKTRPVAIFWDAAALLSAPVGLLRSTGTTTFSGALRAVSEPASSPLAAADRREAFRLAKRALPLALQHPDDPAPRIDLCAAALLTNRAADDDAGRRTERDELGRDAYALATALHLRYEHVGQGEATAALLPAAIRRLPEAAAGTARRLAEALELPASGGSPAEVKEAAAQTLSIFYDSVGMPSHLGALQIPRDELPLIAQASVKNFNANPGPRDEDEAAALLAFLEEAW